MRLQEGETVLQRLANQLRTVVCVLAAGLIPGGFAQITTTGIHGVVRDPSGANIPNATLSLRDTSTGIEKTTTASAEGTFAFVNLVAGTYSLTASAPGFQKKT